MSWIGRTLAKLCIQRQQDAFINRHVTSPSVVIECLMTSIACQSWVNVSRNVEKAAQRFKHCRANPLLPEYQARVGEGLSKLLAFLREEGERERLVELEKLVPVGTQVFSSTTVMPPWCGTVSVSWQAFLLDECFSHRHGLLWRCVFVSQKVFSLDENSARRVFLSLGS